MMLNLGQLNFLRRLKYTTPSVVEGYLTLAPWLVFDGNGAPSVEIEHTVENYYTPEYLNYFRFFSDTILTTTGLTDEDNDSDPYILGTIPYDSTETEGAGDYTIIDPSGALACRDKSHANPGQIYLKDRTALIEGWLHYGQTTPAGHTFWMRTPVLDTGEAGSFGYGSFRFIDTVNGDGTTYSSEGFHPLNALSTFQPETETYEERPNWALVARGSEIPTGISYIGTAFGGPKNVYAYGDPSATKPKFTDETESAANLPMVRRDGSNGSETQLWNIELDANGRPYRCLNWENFNDSVLVGVEYGNNIDDATATGIMNRNSSRVLIEFCKNYKGSYGDAIYVTASKVLRAAFNTGRAIQGLAADAWQITGEGNVSQFCEDIQCLGNTYDFDYQYGSGKGASANEDGYRIAHEICFARGGYFGITTNHFNDYVGHCLIIGTGLYDPQLSGAYTRSWNAIGGGASRSSGKSVALGNVAYDIVTFQEIGGFKANVYDYEGPDPSSGDTNREFNRTNIISLGNRAVKCDNVFRATEPWSGINQWGVFAGTTRVDNDLDKGTADIRGTVASATQTGGTATLTLDDRTHAYTGEDILFYIYGANEADYNQIEAVPTLEDHKEISYSLNGASPVTPATGSITYRGRIKDFGSRNLRYIYTNDGDYISPLSAVPVISTDTGACEEGAEATCTVTLGANQTVDAYIWHTDDGRWIEEMSGATAKIPFGLFGVNTVRPDLTDLKDTQNNRKRLGCFVLYHETDTGAYGMETAIWEDDSYTAVDEARFIFYGSDYLKDMVGTPATWESEVEAFFSGKTVHIEDECTDTYDSSDLQAGVDTMLAGYSVESYPTYVIIEALGNSIITSGGYGSATQADLNQMRADLRYIMDAVTAKGFIPVLADCPYHYFGSVTSSFARDLYDEEDSSLPYIKDILRPLCADTPYSYPTGIPWLQYSDAIEQNTYDNLDAVGTVAPTANGLKAMKDVTTHGLMRYVLTGIYPKEIHRCPFLPL